MNLSVRRAATKQDWAGLPWDVLTAIFEKIEAVWIIVSVQAVCRQWRKVSLEPYLWRHIDITSTDSLTLHVGLVVADLNNGDKIRLDLSHVLSVAVNRSKGKLASLTIRNMSVNDILKFVAETAGELKQLRLISCAPFSLNMGNTVEPFGNLSELEISYCLFKDSEYEFIFGLCPNLETLRLNHPLDHYLGPFTCCNLELFAIAKTMSRLRELKICCYRLNNIALRACLDGCPDLESLDLSECAQLKFDDHLKEKCKRLSVLSLPGGVALDNYSDDYDDYGVFSSEDDVDEDDVDEDDVDEDDDEDNDDDDDDDDVNDDDLDYGPRQ